MNSIPESLPQTRFGMPIQWWSSTSLYRRYVIALIWVMLLLRFVDLQIIGVLLESIRAEFAVSDTELGLLSGFAFSILYGILGIPVDWLADRYSRTTILACAVGLWSLMTGLCRLATSFASLFLARVGVGVGEAGGTAPAYSLVSELVAARATRLRVRGAQLSGASGSVHRVPHRRLSQSVLWLARRVSIARRDRGRRGSAGAAHSRESRARAGFAGTTDPIHARGA